MTPIAIVTLIVSIVVLWGGLAAAVIHLNAYDKKTGEHDFEEYEDHTT
ncbi:methionine/alanine import family NSS transporter small subunit [Timonella sp. A28]